MYHVKKFGIYFLCFWILTSGSAGAKTVTFDNVPVKNSQNYSIFSRDLNRVEMELFGKIYSGETDENRIKRIENKLYGKTYENSTLSQRMNTIVRDYISDRYWSQNGSTYCSPENSKVLSRLKNALIGQPMGYTPPVYEPSPYINTYGPSYMRGYYGTNGWNSHNSFNPIYTGAGVHILD